MFKQLIEVWKGKETFLDDIIKDFEEMMTISHRMFNLVSEALFAGKAMGDLKTVLYKEDSRLNFLEQTIRRKIVTQLSTREEEPLAACLILMSISKDAERLGDYAKNILEVFEIKSKLGKEEPYYGNIEKVKSRISGLFKEVLTAYHESDQKKARQLVRDSFEHQKICNQTIKELLMAKPGEDHVAYAVLTRFFKRILAHLSNIATSVFMPVTKIDFFDPHRRDEEMNQGE